jgi:hypothetical protein
LSESTAVELKFESETDAVSGFALPDGWASESGFDRLKIQTKLASTTMTTLAVSIARVGRFRN